MSDVSLEPGAARIAFGPEARRYAARLPAGLSVIVADHHDPAAALAAAIERRRQGRLFYVAPLVDDIRALAATTLSGVLYRAHTSTDARRHAFDALADDRIYASLAGLERPVAADSDDDIDERARIVLGISNPVADAHAVSEALRLRFGLPPLATLPAAMSEPERRVLADLAISGDALLARSRREVERIATLLGRRRPHTAVAPGRDDTVPAFVRSEERTVVVWAPEADAATLGVIASALDAYHIDAVYVCQSGMLPGARGTFVRPADGASALSAARLVIDTACSDPATAIALAERDLPVLVTTTSGATEFLDGANAYDPWNWRSVHAAIASAIGQRRVVVTGDPLPLASIEATLARSAPVPPAREPLVSVLIPTMDRPHTLAVALDSLARQSYTNIEAIVVNNGTTDITNVVGRYPFVRVIENGRNIGVPAFFLQATSAMTGAYFCVLPDDDIDFPDFLTRLVTELENTGASIAHGNTVTRYFEHADGADRTVSYRVRSYRPLDQLTIRAGATMTLHSMLFRSTVIREIGTFDATLTPCDLEYQIRAAETFDFVHVDAVTTCWNCSMKSGSYNTTAEFARDMRRLYERYPAGGSTILERLQHSELARFEDRSRDVLWAPDLMLAKPETVR